MIIPKPEWHYLDPDYRKSPPNDNPFCCRCQKKVNANTAVRVELNEDYTLFRVNENGSHWIGIDCFKKQTKP